MSKVFLLTLSFRKGGAENQLMKLAIYLQNKGYDTNIISLLPGNDFDSIINDYNIGFDFINIKSFKGIITLYKFFKKGKPNLIVSFMFAANIIARIFKLSLKIPLITSVRNNNISKLYRIIYRFTYKIDDFTTFNSEYALNRFLSLKLTNSKKSVLINNAVSLNKKVYLKPKNKIFTLISIAHFRPQKDYKTLFKAIKVLKQKKIKIKLLVIGHTFDLSWPYEMTKSLDIIEEVDILGFKNNIEKYIIMSDALVLSTLWEGTPNAILEAMSNKLPIISSKVPGCNKLVQESKSGVLFERENHNDLADKIINIMNLTQEEKLSLGQNGYNYVKANFDEEIVYNKWQNLIRLIIG